MCVNYCEAFVIQAAQVRSANACKQHQTLTVSPPLATSEMQAKSWSNPGAHLPRSPAVVQPAAISRSSGMHCNCFTAIKKRRVYRAEESVLEIETMWWHRGSARPFLVAGSITPISCPYSCFKSSKHTAGQDGHFR